MVYKYIGENYYDFLNKIGYSKELLYLVKVKSITESLEIDSSLLFQSVNFTKFRHIKLFFRNFVF